jgi:hypothetical protein
MMNENDIKKLLLRVEATPPAESWEKVIATLEEMETDIVLHDQLLEAEVYPPAGIWQQLSKRFDEEQANDAWAAKLNQTEVNPPLPVWENIQQQLEDADFAKQLDLAAVHPPAPVWDAISTQLDVEADTILREKLLQTAVNPPAKSWALIEAQLGAETGAKVISIGSRFNTIYKLAAAAVVTGIIAWGAYQLFATQNGTNRPEFVRNTKPQPNTQPVAPAVTNQEVKEPAANTTKTTVAVQPKKKAGRTASPKPVIRNKITEPLVDDIAVAAIAEPANHSSQTTVSYNKIHHKPKAGNSTTQAMPENRYLLVLNENGDLIRVSKKLANLKCAKTTDFPTDAVAALQSRDCESQIKQWQQHLATSTIVSPAGGYIDMNELLKATEK